MAQKKVCTRHETADPPGTNAFPIDRHGFAEGFVCFHARVVRNRRRQVLLGIVESSAVRSRGRQGEKSCISYLRRPELSAQVRQHNSFTSCSQEYGKGVPIAPRPKLFVVRRERRSRYLLIGCASIDAKACLSRSNIIHSRPTKSPSSPNCKQSRMWGLGRHYRWSWHMRQQGGREIVS